MRKIVNLLLVLTFIFLPTVFADKPKKNLEKNYSALDYLGVPLDHILAEILNYKENGVFIEVGAFDGVTYSNTKLFEEFFGWRGILIEPSEVLFSKLCINRPNSKCFQCALGSFDEDGIYKVGDFDGHPMSSLTNRTGHPQDYKVLIRSLQSIIDECGFYHINLFSLDTEGYELDVLKGIDFDKTTFDYLFIEIYKHQYKEMVAFLSSKGYEMVSCISNYNRESNPGWDGTHNDYLFRRKDLGR